MAFLKVYILILKILSQSWTKNYATASFYMIKLESYF